MAGAVETPNSLQEKALVEIAARSNGTEEFAQSFEAEIEDPSFPSGSRDWSMIQLTSGGQDRLYDPEEEKTFSATMYIKGVDASTAAGIESLFHTGEVSGSSATKDVVSDLARDDLRLTFLATTEDVSSATASTSSGNTAYRMVMQNAEVVSADTDFEDNVLKVEFEIKTNAFTPDGTPNVRKQSVASGSDDSLVALPAYNDDFGIEDGDFDTTT